MKSVYTILIIFVALHTFSQEVKPHNDAGKLDDWSRININIYIPGDSVLIDIPLKQSEYNSMSQTLRNKLKSFVAKNGFSGTDRSPRFMLFPRIILLESSYTATAPTMVVQKLELSLYVADYLDQKTFDVVTFTIKGLGRTKEQAMRRALNDIKYNKQIEKFLKNSKQQILAYYNDQCDFIMQEVEMLATTHRYKTAFHMLLQVPQASKACYEEAIKRLPEYHKMMAKRDCEKSLQKAKVAWAAKSKSNVYEREAAAQVGNDKDEVANKYKNEEDGSEISEINASVNAKETNKYIYEALTHLDGILPDSECYVESNQLIEEIKQYVGEEEYFKNVKKYEDDHELRLQQIRNTSLSLQMDMMEMEEKQNKTAGNLSH